MPNQPAKNFYGGRYNMEVLQEGIIMYRAGNSQNPYGRWFTSEPPASVKYQKERLCILDLSDRKGAQYVGGHDIMQTYIDSPWLFEIVGKTPLQ